MSVVTATFLFTDLVDSTATAARLGPGGADALRQTHFRLLRGAIAAAGGTEVKNLGDGLMVVFSSPSRALACSVGMQQAVEHHNQSGSEPLGVRIGLATGEAVEEDGDYFGDPVVEAARLCAAAAAGQILATELVRLMVGRHAAQSFIEMEPLELKGIPQPVDAVEVVWEPASGAGSVPLPGRLVGAATDALFGFFGRSAELEALASARKRAHADRQCEVVFVAGEAGMGKTALVAQSARAAHADGAVVLFGHADEDLGVAYQPWIEVLSSLVRASLSEPVDTLPSAQRGALARLVPAVAADGARVSDPDVERLLLLQATSELLAAASRASPVMIVLDDVHWVDAASLQLLRHVVASATPMDVVIACTYRDTDLGRGDALTKLLADLHREANVTRLTLSGLDSGELADLLAAAAGHELDDDGIGLAHALRRETGGNPFFTAEILRHLGETGGIVLGSDGRWTVAGELEDLGLPGSIRDVVGRRVERLGDETTRVLSLAAVMGREFDVGVLGTITDVDEDALIDLLDAAVNAAVLVESAEGDRYRFAHALIQHTLYEDLSVARRQRAHQLVAEALESRAAGDDASVLADLARHWVAATRPAELDKALGYVRRAGDAARDSLSPDDAIRWYSQALELAVRQPQPDEGLRAELLAELGSAQRQIARPEYHDSLLGAAAIAERLGLTDTLVKAALGFSRRASAGMVGDIEARRVIQAALDATALDATAQRALLISRLVETHDAPEWLTRRELSLEALELARRAGNDAAFVEAVAMTGDTLATPERLPQLIADVGRAAEIADRLGDPELQARVRYHQFRTLCMQTDMPGVDATIDRLGALTKTLGLPHQRWQLALLITGRLLLSGRSAETEAANDETLRLGIAADAAEALGVYGALLFDVRREQGRLSEIADFFVDAARDNPMIAVLRAAVPTALLGSNRIDEARDRLAVEAAAGFDFPYDGSWLTAMCHLADTAATVGDRDAARSLIERIAPFADQVNCPTTLVEGAVARPLARLATLVDDYDRAEAWFAVAHDVNGRLAAPYWTALGQLDHADLCVARGRDGDFERARALASAGGATAAAYGFAGVTARAETLLGTA